MKVVLEGTGASLGHTVEVKRDRDWGPLTLTPLAGERLGEPIEIDGLDLWRAVLALMADPEANGLRKDPFALP